MGVGSSVPAQGVEANPRLVYADKMAKKNKNETYKIDAPVLIDVKHGSIRYRYAKDEQEPSNKSKRIEKPFEGDKKDFKKDYFYHPRLNDFSEKASVDKEEPYKFLRVTKGPNSCKQKKIFYVTGKGWGAKDDTVVTKPTTSKAMGKDPTWPQRQNPNHLYFNCIFIDEAPVTSTNGVDQMSAEMAHSMIFTLRDNETVNEVKRKIANRVTKSATHIHVCYKQEELDGDDIIGDLRQGDDNNDDFFCVQLSLMEQ